MKKYVRALICLSYSLFRFLLIKIFHPKNFKFTICNLISPFTEIEINKDAKLSLGKMVRIRSGSKVRVRNGAELKIGDNSSLNHGCMLISHEKITIGKNVQLGPNVLIFDHDHDYRIANGLKELRYKTSPVQIGNNVWVGANTVILRGTTIGDGAVIGAGCVVKSNVPKNTVLVQKRESNILPIV